jgi:hypothetical protein
MNGARPFIVTRTVVMFLVGATCACGSEALSPSIDGGADDAGVDSSIDAPGADSHGDADGAGVDSSIDASGADSHGDAVADGAVADDAVADGAVADGAVADGAVADGAVDANVCLADASCDDGNPCTVDSCDPSKGCIHVDASACTMPFCALPTGCAFADADGDGLSDTWETAHYIDVDCNGVQNAGDVALPLDALPTRPDVFVDYDWMDYSPEQRTCAVATDCTMWGNGHVGETCISGHCGYACNVDGDCTSRGPSHATDKCVSSVCVHTHDPEVIAPGAIALVQARFAARGFNLHVTRGSARPHSQVLSFRTLGIVTDGCEGGSQGSGNTGSGQYVESFYDLKTAAPAAGPVLRTFHHYMIFAHYNSCDTPAHCAACPPTGKIPTPPGFGASGLAEIDGNDFMVSLGNVFQDKAVRATLFNVGGTFMHELGHNLGLRHGGGSDLNSDAEDAPIFKPNFISVMNYKFQLNGVQSADTPGSIVPDPTLTRLDYSTQTLPTGGNTPGELVELAPPGLNEPAGLGSGNGDLTSFDDGACNFGFQPTDGPLDYDGDGTTTGTQVSADLNRQDHPSVMTCPSGVTETLNGHTEWGPAPGQSIFTYRFQCTPFYADGAIVPAGISSNELTAEMAERAHALEPPSPVSHGRHCTRDAR